MADEAPAYDWDAFSRRRNLSLSDDASKVLATMTCDEQFSFLCYRIAARRGVSTEVVERLLEDSQPSGSKYNDIVRSAAEASPKDSHLPDFLGGYGRTLEAEQQSCEVAAELSEPATMSFNGPHEPSAEKTTSDELVASLEKPQESEEFTVFSDDDGALDRTAPLSILVTPDGGGVESVKKTTKTECFGCPEIQGKSDAPQLFDENPEKEIHINHEDQDSGSPYQGIYYPLHEACEFPEKHALQPLHVLDDTPVRKVWARQPLILVQEGNQLHKPHSLANFDVFVLDPLSWNGEKVMLNGDLVALCGNYTQNVNKRLWDFLDNNLSSKKRLILDVMLTLESSDRNVKSTTKFAYFWIPDCLVTMVRARVLICDDVSPGIGVTEMVDVFVRQLEGITIKQSHRIPKPWIEVATVFRGGGNVTLTRVACEFEVPQSWTVLVSGFEGGGPRVWHCLGAELARLGNLIPYSRCWELLNNNICRKFL